MDHYERICRLLLVTNKEQTHHIATKAMCTYGEYKPSILINWKGSYGKQYAY